MKDINIIDKQREAYKNKFLKYGATPEGTFQNDTQTQFLRFERLIKNIKPYINGATIHDVGSGACDLHNYLLLNNIEHQYSGTEIVQEMITYSKNKYPDIQIFNHDLVATHSSDKYDFVVLSGTLNIFNKLRYDEWKEYSLNLIRKMFDMANKAIVFNFLTTYNTYSSPQLMYLNPCEMLDFCITSLSRFTQIDHGYPLYEATISVFKKPFVNEIYHLKEFEKYFAH